MARSHDAIREIESASPRAERSGAEREGKACLSTSRASIRKTGWKRDHNYNRETTWPRACVFSVSRYFRAHLPCGSFWTDRCGVFDKYSGMRWGGRTLDGNMIEKLMGRLYLEP